MKSKTDSPQLFELTRPIPKRLIEQPAPGKYGSYVPHFVIAQALLAVTGPYDFTVTEILRGPVEEFTTKEGKKHPALPNAVVGAVCRMIVEVDGRTVTIEEVGSCTAEAFINNDGERLKRATSDALKRCAMRLGVGLHLWCKRPDQFFINEVLLTAVGVTLSPPAEEAVVGIEEDHE